MPLEMERVVSSGGMGSRSQQAGAASATPHESQLEQSFADPTGLTSWLYHTCLAEAQRGLSPASGLLQACALWLNGPAINCYPTWPHIKSHPVDCAWVLSVLQQEPRAHRFLCTGCLFHTFFSPHPQLLFTIFHF